MSERDDRLPAATLAGWFRGQVDLYQKLLDKSPMLRDDETVRERVQVFRAALDRLEELTAAADAARAEERERCAKVADAFAVHQYADPKLVAAAIRKGPTR